MEDKKGGMVAVVQGRRDAGLTVTLIGRYPTLCANDTSLPLRGVATTSMDTGTGSMGMHDTGAQICDDRYVSSYQLSHCNATPSSPPVLATEFPRQTQLNRTQGNFDISGCGSFESSCFKMRFSGNGHTGPDRGTEAFVKSLRQYPSVPAGDNLSSEVIQQLIVYTQAKNCEFILANSVSKSSRHTKSMRNLRIRNSKGQSGLTPRVQNTSKGLQTYTRATRNTKERDVDVEMKRREEPCTGSRAPDYARDVKDDILDGIYDYLRPVPEAVDGGQTRSAEVRYLGDIARRVKNTVRQIYEDRREDCPNIERRYNRHRNDHHRGSCGVQSDFETNTTENEAPATMASTEVAKQAPCQPDSNAFETYQPNKICCYCKQRIPCKCDPRASTQTHKFSCKTDNKLPQTLSTQSYTVDINKNDVLPSKIEHEVFAWIDEIPISVKEKPEDRVKREKLAKLLVDKLNIVKRDQYFEENAQNEILECLNNMPMWHPGNRNDEQTFKAHIVNNLLYKIRKISNDNNHNDIALIVDSIPFILGSSSKAFDKSGMKKDLVDSLSRLIKRTPPNLKSEVIDILKAFPINIKGDNSTYLNDLAEVLTDKLQSISLNLSNPDSLKIEKEFEAKIIDWLQDIHQLVDFNTEFKEIYILTQPLVQKLFHLQKHGIYDIDIQRKMQDVINDWLKDNIQNNLELSTLHKLSVKLLNSLLDFFDEQDDNELILKVIDWLNKTQPHFVEDLGKKLHDFSTNGESPSKTEIIVLNYLTKYLENQSDKLGVKNLNEFRKKLRNRLDKKKISRHRRLIDEVFNCLEDSTLSNVYSNENKNIIYQCVKKIEQLREENGNICGRAIVDEISKLVTKLIENSIIEMSSKSKTNLVKKLTNLVVPEIVHKRPDLKINGKNKDNIQNLVRNILDAYGLIQNNHISRELENKLTSTLFENNVNNKKNIVTKVVDFLNNNTDLELNQINEIAQKVASQFLLLFNPEHSNTSLDTSLEETLKNEVNSVLNNSSVQPKYRDKIESTICDILADEIMRNDSSKMTNEEIMTVLKSTFLSDEESEKLVNEFINRGRHIFLKYKTKSFSETHNKNLVDSAHRNILEFTQQLKGEFDNISVWNWEAATQKLAEQVVNIKQSAQSSLDEKNRLRKEVKKYFQKMNIGSEDQANKLINRLQHLSLKTSTPRSSRDKELSFYCEESSEYANISSIVDDNSFDLPCQKFNTTNEDAYRLQLVNKINNWMQSLPIDVGSEGIHKFKEAMAKDLADEIIERQKYLQLNYTAKTSEEEELEYLKYQVFRWLNKSPHIKQLLTSITKTNELMKQIKELHVPQMVKLNKHIIETQPKEESRYKLIANEIFKWTEKVPIHLYLSTDKIYHRRLITDLIEHIEELQQCENLTETDLDSILFKWFQKIFNVNEEYIQIMVNELKTMLVNQQLIRLRNNSRSINEAENIKIDMNSIIFCWLKEKSFYKEEKASNKKIQDQIATDLSEALNNALKYVASITNNVQKDRIILGVIKSHIKKIPMKPHLKNDSLYLQFLSDNLLQHIKSLNFYSHTRESFANNDNDDVVVDEWINSLFLVSDLSPLVKGNLIKLKNELKDIARDIHKQNTNSSSTYDLKEEIKKCLQRHPIPLKDHILLDHKINDLCIKLNDRNVHPRIEPTIERILREIINNWAKHLPFQIGESCDNIKKDIEAFIAKIKEVIEVSTLNNLTKVKAELEKQINEFLKTLPILMNQSNQSHVLKLISKILELINTTLSQESSLACQISNIPLTRRSGGNFFDDIKSWCNTLPIPDGNTINEQENNKILKQNIANKITNKIAELNMKPEIFNDDILYLDLIRDEIDYALNDLPQSNELEKNRIILKQMLIDKVKIAKQQAEYDLAGHAYKQKLREVISNTLPSAQNLSVEEQVPFEILKERLADAFINLNYSAHNDNLKNKFKKEITDEISRYCNNYLKRYPASPLDPVILNQELYNALQKVPTPRTETIKAQVEQLRIKNKIYNWLKTLPLKEETPIEQLQKNKIISILAKDLHNLRKAKLLDDHNDINKKMKHIVIKWMKKLSLQPRAENVIDKLSENLIADLKFSEHNPKTNIDLEKTSNNIAHLTQSDSSWTKYSSLKNDRLSKYIPPASRLSQEEIQRLKKIKRRSQPSSYPQQRHSKDTISIPEEDSNLAHISQHSYSHTDGKETKEPYYFSTKEPISPNIIVNEYNWDNTEASLSQNDEIELERRSQMSLQEQSDHSINQLSPHNTTQHQSEQVWSQPLKSAWKSNLLTQPPLVVIPKPLIPRELVESRPAQPYAEPPPRHTLSQTIPQMNSHPLHSPLSSAHEISYRNNSRNITKESHTLSKTPQQQKLTKSTSSRDYDNSLPHQSTYKPITAAQPNAEPSPRETLYQTIPQMKSHPLHTLPSSSQEISCSNNSKSLTKGSQILSKTPDMPKPQKITNSTQLRDYDNSSPHQPSYRPITAAQPNAESSPRESLYQTIPQMSSHPLHSPPSSSQEISRTNNSKSVTKGSQTLSKTPDMLKPQKATNSTLLRDYDDSSPHQTSYQPITKIDSYSSPRPESEPRRKTRQSQTNSSIPEMSNISPQPGTNRDRTVRHDIGTNSPPENTRMPRLATIDVHSRMRNFGNQSFKRKRRKGSTDEDCDWTMSFPEHTDLWDSTDPYKKPSYRICIPSANDKEIKENVTERIKCQCKERVLGKCMSKQSRETNKNVHQTGNLMQHCPACCGVHYCPHPSYLYFK